MAKGKKSSALYTLKQNVEKSDIVGVVKEEYTSELWNKRLGHMTKKVLKILLEKNILPGINGTEINFCGHCIVGKKRRVAFIRDGPKRDT